MPSEVFRRDVVLATRGRPDLHARFGQPTRVRPIGNVIGFADRACGQARC
jgi:hypothetical protein